MEYHRDPYWVGHVLNVHDIENNIALVIIYKYVDDILFKDLMEAQNNKPKK